jgi:hypothetical protein
MALLIFSGLTTVALIGWFYKNPAPWNWKSLLAIGCAMLGVTTSALVWRAPSRGHAVMGILTMIVSLARIGPPDEWTWASYSLVAVTLLLLLPLVNAAVAIRAD